MINENMNIWHQGRHLLVKAMGTLVEDSFKILLSEKHLYQCSEVNSEALSSATLKIQSSLDVELLPQTGTTSEKFILKETKKLVETIWVPNQVTPTSYQVLADSFPIGFDLPTINTFCGACKARWPFNPVAEGSYLLQGRGQDEFFYLGYQCQQCKGDPIRFLVRREGLRLRLAGRYPLEVLPTPNILPKAASKYYGNAVIAHHAGQTLAGLFLLRVFIEQFWRTVPKVKDLIALQSKATGDEQGHAYQSTLPDDFKSRFPSLTDVYDKLSAAIHSADENAALFDDSCAKIVKHFDARRVYEI